MHDVANNVDRSIQRQWFICSGEWRDWVVTEIMEAASMGATLGLGQIGCFGFNPEDHVTGVEANHSIGMGGAVIEKMNDSLHSLFSALALLSHDSTNGGEHSVIHSMGIE